MHHLALYAGSDDLVSIAKTVLGDRSRSSRIADAGYSHYSENYGPEIVRREFFDIVDGRPGRSPHELSREPRARKPRSSSDSWLRQRINIYEFVQEFHRQAAHLRIFCTAHANPEIIADLADLPRATIQVDKNYADFALREIATWTDNWCPSYVESSETVGRAAVIISAPKDVTERTLNRWLNEFHVAAVVVSADASDHVNSVRVSDLLRRFSPQLSCYSNGVYVNKGMLKKGKPS
jgi:hypothetical protein